jgi:putative hydrolase of the HAD superfamily
LKKIGYVVFDFGGVISKKQNEKIVKKMCRILNIPVTEFESLYTAQRRDYDSGIIDVNTYWQKTVELIDKKVDQKDLDRLIEYDIKSWLDINQETIEYIRAINDMVTLGLLSNMTYDTLREISHLYWFDFFKAKILSCEVKVAKPDFKIYGICLQSLNAKPYQVLFVDDSEENIGAARKIGINVIKFTNCKTLKSIIENKYILGN